jgi:uncharacterized repeat protein (TIGR01451 family)
MQVEIAQAGCIVPLPSVDMTIAVTAQPPIAYLGNSVTLTFNVDNLGTLPATNVGVFITLPNNVSFVSVGASTGSCNNGGGIVTCMLGDVPGTSGRTVTLTTLAATIGNGQFDATVTAENDDVANNNQQAVQLTIEQAVDLVINTPAAATIELNQSTTVTAVLENLSDMDATGVTLSISLSNGLQANSATWSLGNCTVAAQQVDCQSNSFVAQSSSTLDLNITGVTAGTRSYTVTLASNEADANMADNSITGTVRVNGPGGSDDDDSGGGSMGLAFLAFLCCAMLWTRRRSLLRQHLRM